MTALYHPERDDIVRLLSGGPLGCVTGKSHSGDPLILFTSATIENELAIPVDRVRLVARGSIWSELLAAAEPFRKAWRRSGNSLRPPQDYLSIKHWRDFQRAYDAIGGAHG